MFYSRNMGADRPGLFVFVVDQSGSMANDWPGGQQDQEKCVALADILNTTIEEIGSRCFKGTCVSPRCDLVMIGYEGANIRSVWEGALARRDVASITDVAANPAEQEEVEIQVEDGRGGLVSTTQKRPVWIKPHAGASTPAAQALAKVRGIIEEWVKDERHKDSFPPIVIHITDGQFDDPAAAEAEGKRLTDVSTSDGNVLLVNIHVPDSYGYPLLYPAASTDLPPNSPDAHVLFEMSSHLPRELFERALGAKLPVKQGSRLMIANADAVSVMSLINFVTVGTVGRSDEILGAQIS